MTLKEAKDKAAKEYGYRDWKDIYSSFDAGDLSYQILEIVIDDAMEIYASQQRTEVWNSAIEAAAESAYIADDGEHIVSKQSILKLKR